MTRFPVLALAVLFVARWGGDAKDIATAIVVDDRAVFVAGYASSRDFPTTTGRELNGNLCAFATKLDAAAGAGIYSTALCTRDMTFAFAAAPGPNGELWVAGSTDGPDLPVTPDAAQKTFGGSPDPARGGDAMLIRWSADGRSLRYATYFGGAEDERATALAADGAGGVWMAGRSSGAKKGFLAHIDSRGTLVTSRAEDDEITTMAAVGNHRLAIGTAMRRGVGGFFLDAEKNAKTGVEFGVVMGGIGAGSPARATFRSVTGLADGTVVFAGDSQPCPRAPAGASDGLLYVLPPGRDGASGAGTPRSYCIGGTGADEIHGIAAAPDGTVWITGLTDSRDFPVTTGTRPEYDTQAFLAQVDPGTGRILTASLLGADVAPRRDVARGYAVAVAKNGRVFAAGEATGSLLFRPTLGAFRAGQPFESTDPFVVSVR